MSKLAYTISIINKQGDGLDIKGHENEVTVNKYYLTVFSNILNLIQVFFRHFESK